MITTLTLNPALDFTLEVDEFLPDDSNRVQKSARHAGGKGINVSRIVKLLGGPVTTLGLLGGPEGVEIRNLLKKAGIHIWTVNLESRTRENIAIFSLRDKALTRINSRGGIVKPGEYKELLNLLNQLADNATIFVLSGSLPPGISKDTYFELVSRIKTINPACRVILDADGDVLKKGIKARPFMIKPNVHELQRLTGLKINTDAQIIKAVEKIKKMVDFVVVSKGSKGSLAFLPDNSIVQIIPPKVKALSTIGAGDSLIAGIALALNKKPNDFEQALCMGTAISSLKVMTFGNSFKNITMSAVKKYLPKSKNKIY